MAAMKSARRLVAQYLRNILISLDQLANTLLLGDPDETLSSRMGKHVREGRCRLCHGLCRVLHFIHPEHCEKSIEDDRGDRGLLK